MLAGGAAIAERHVVRAQPVVSVPAPQDHGPGGNSLDPELTVGGEPARDRCRGLRRVAALDAVPAHGVCPRIVGLEVEDPRVAAAPLEPAAGTLGRVVPRLPQPAAQNVRKRPFAQERRDPGKDRSRQCVALRTAVAVDELAVG